MHIFYITTSINYLNWLKSFCGSSILMSLIYELVRMYTLNNATYMFIWYNKIRIKNSVLFRPNKNLHGKQEFEDSMLKVSLNTKSRSHWHH